jgi:hypothetical protein
MNFFHTGNSVGHDGIVGYIMAVPAPDRDCRLLMARQRAGPHDIIPAMAIHAKQPPLVMHVRGQAMVICQVNRLGRNPVAYRGMIALVIIAGKPAGIIASNGRAVVAVLALAGRNRPAECVGHRISPFSGNGGVFAAVAPVGGVKDMTGGASHAAKQTRVVRRSGAHMAGQAALPEKIVHQVGRGPDGFRRWGQSF